MALTGRTGTSGEAKELWNTYSDAKQISREDKMWQEFVDRVRDKSGIEKNEDKKKVRADWKNWNGDGPEQLFNAFQIKQDENDVKVRANLLKDWDQVKKKNAESREKHQKAKSDLEEKISKDVKNKTAIMNKKIEYKEKTLKKTEETRKKQVEKEEKKEAEEERKRNESTKEETDASRKRAEKNATRARKKKEVDEKKHKAELARLNEEIRRLQAYKENYAREHERYEYFTKLYNVLTTELGKITKEKLTELLKATGGGLPKTEYQQSWDNADKAFDYANYEKGPMWDWIQKNELNRQPFPKSELSDDVDEAADQVKAMIKGKDSNVRLVNGKEKEGSKTWTLWSFDGLKESEAIPTADVYDDRTQFPGYGSKLGEWIKWHTASNIETKHFRIFDGVIDSYIWANGADDKPDKHHRRHHYWLTEGIGRCHEYMYAEKTFENDDDGWENPERRNNVLNFFKCTVKNANSLLSTHEQTQDFRNQVDHLILDPQGKIDLNVLKKVTSNHINFALVEHLAEDLNKYALSMEHVKDHGGLPEERTMNRLPGWDEGQIFNSEDNTIKYNKKTAPKEKTPSGQIKMAYEGMRLAVLQFWKDVSEEDARNPGHGYDPSTKTNHSCQDGSCKHRRLVVRECAGGKCGDHDYIDGPTEDLFEGITNAFTTYKEYEAEDSKDKGDDGDGKYYTEWAKKRRANAAEDRKAAYTWINENIETLAEKPTHKAWFDMTESWKEWDTQRKRDTWKRDQDQVMEILHPLVDKYAKDAQRILDNERAPPKDYEGNRLTTNDLNQDNIHHAAKQSAIADLMLQSLEDLGSKYTAPATPPKEEKKRE